MLKPLSLLLMLASVGFAQSIRIGVEGGVPLTNAFATHTLTTYPPGIVMAPINYAGHTKRYIAGVTAELDLPFRLAVKADLLYKRLSFDSASISSEAMVGTTTANSFEFPVLAKYSRGKLGPLQPYVEAGVAFRQLQGVSQTLKLNCAMCTRVTQTSHPAELSHTFTKGFTAGAGLEFRALLVGVFGELRYTRWTADAFSDPNGGINSRRNQADLLVGVTF